MKKINVNALLSNDMVKGMILPAVIYWGAGKFVSGYMLGVITIGYTLMVTLYGMAKEKKVNIFGAISLLFLLVTTVGMIFFKTEKFIQMKGVLMNLLMAMVFLVSLLGEKSLMQRIVENGPYQNDENFKKTALYKQIWRNETLMWAAYYALIAVVKFVLIQNTTTSTYFSINAIISNGSFYALLAYSYVYPEQKIKKVTQSSTANVL